MPKRNFTKVYFDQGIQYYSESGDSMITIADMVPAYAANAARRLLTDAPVWCNEAGQITSHPARWMISTPLFSALIDQAKS
jgi:hypothetical protein